MSDIENKEKGKLDKLDGNPFFSLFTPYFDFIGKGKIFNLVYFLLAVINLFIPFFVIYQIINMRFFQYAEAKHIFAFIFAWLVVCFACWVGFQLWWNRRKRVTVIGKSEFIAIPLLSDIVQTFGEWLGTLIAIIGAGAGLFTTIFLGNEADVIFSYMGLDFLSYGIMNIIMGPIIGFFIVIIFRFFAELMRVVAALANNTKDIADNLKK